MKNELMKKYNIIESLRKKVKSSGEAMTYYNYLKAINTGDALYGWIFDNDAILTDTLDDLDLYQYNYIIDILNVYAGELKNILTKSGVNYEE